MAKIVGESGAKKDFLQRINDLLRVYTVRDLDHVNKLKKSIPHDIEKKRLELKKELENEKMKLEKNIPILKDNIRIREARTEKVINIIIKEIEKLIEALNLKLNTDSVFKYLRYPSVKSDLSSQKEKLNEIKNSKEEKIKNSSFPLSRELIIKSNRLKKITENFEEIIEYKLKEMYSDLDIVTNLNKDLLRYYKGALGEETVISIIGKNFDEWFVLFNDLEISLSPPIRYNNKYIRNEQVDHVLVCPKGVFAIETKSWSDAYINEIFSDGKFTPIQQIERKGYALYKLLNDNSISYSKIKVKDLLVSTDKKLPTPQDSYVKSITVSYLKTYLKRYPINLNHEQINKIVEKLRKISPKCFIP